MCLNWHHVSMSVLSHAVFKHLFYIFSTVCSVEEEDLHEYVVVNFLSHVILLMKLKQSGN